MLETEMKEDTKKVARLVPPLTIITQETTRVVAVLLTLALRATSLPHPGDPTVAVTTEEIPTQIVIQTTTPTEEIIIREETLIITTTWIGDHLTLTLRAILRTGTESTPLAIITIIATMLIADRVVSNTSQDMRKVATEASTEAAMNAIDIRIMDSKTLIKRGSLTIMKMPAMRELLERALRDLNSHPQLTSLREDLLRMLHSLSLLSQLKVEFLQRNFRHKLQQAQP
jgi:hypothetical protein